MSNEYYTPQLVQAILVGSAALLGFTGVLVVQLAKFVSEPSDRTVAGIIAAISVGAFICCVLFGISWLEFPSYVFNSTIPDIDKIKWSFCVQALAFILLFVGYLGSTFFNNRNR
jgi:hypothetical protein